ncbi:hypothetical protein [Virgisporangium aurantiacum]|nr:hypothetical protein [Virgisporangium aurantiacum]
MLPTHQHRAIRTVVALLVASLALGVVFAVLTLLFRHDVLAYQLARQPGADPDELSRTLWTRPIPVLVVAVLYVWVARQLLAGRPRAYRRVRIVSVVGFVAIAWLVASAAYPLWLRGVQVAQLAVLAALIVAVNRPVVRAAFPKVADPRPRNLRAAALLAVLAPLVAEVSVGSTSLREIWVIPLYVPIYGAGVLFIREVVRRTGGGVVNLLVMGLAYGLVEEGLALQSLTSRHLYGAADWAPRLFGLNTAYAEANLAYHAVFSVTIPIVLVEARFGAAPYLRRGGVIGTGVVALLGAALLRISVPPSEDPGYTMSLSAVLLTVAVVAALVVVGLRVRVRPSVRPAGPPPVAALAALATAATFAFLGLVWPFAGARQPLFTHGAWALLPMTGAALVAVAVFVALRRWSAGPQWTLRHPLAACFGALVGHTAFGIVAHADTLPDRGFLAVVALVTAIAGAVIVKRIGDGRRAPAVPPAPGSVTTVSTGSGPAHPPAG